MAGDVGETGDDVVDVVGKVLYAGTDAMLAALDFGRSAGGTNAA